MVCNDGRGDTIMVLSTSETFYAKFKGSKVPPGSRKRKMGPDELKAIGRLRAVMSDIKTKGA